MSSYLAVHLEFAREQIPIGLFEHLFSSDFFKPASIGGLYSHEKTDHWFFAGYALEHFISCYSPSSGKRPRVGTVEIAVKDAGEQRDYLVALRKTLPKRRPGIYGLSPYEVTDMTKHVTFLKPEARLDPSVSEVLRQWLDRYPKAIIAVYGSLALAVDNDGLPWTNAFQDYYSYLSELDEQPFGVPMLWIDARALPPFNQPSSVRVTIYSTSQVWLREGMSDLNEGITVANADENLRRLVALTKLLVQRDETRWGAEHSRISLSGSVFFRESERLRTTFAEVGSLPIEIG